MVGTLAGIALLFVIQNLIVQGANLNSYVQQVVSGGFLLVVVILQAAVSRRAHLLALSQTTAPEEPLTAMIRRPQGSFSVGTRGRARATRQSCGRGRWRIQPFRRRSAAYSGVASVGQPMDVVEAGHRRVAWGGHRQRAVGCAVLDGGVWWLPGGRP